MAKALSRTDDEIALIYNNHVKTIYKICYIYLKNRSDTEDAVSDTFVKLIKSSPHFDSPQHQKAWLIRTAINTCKDFLKHWWRKNKDIESCQNELKSENEFDGDEVLTAVCNLPNKYKTVIHLYYYEGYNSVQIADIMSKPKSTIRNYLREARMILKEKLGDYFDEE